MRPVRVGNYSIGQYFTLSLSRSAVTKHVLDLPIELTLPGKPHHPSTHPPTTSKIPLEILWLVRGARKVAQTSGLCAPASITAATILATPQAPDK